METIKKGKYKHSKSGKEYDVLGIGKHTETFEDVVFYQGRYDSDEFGPKPLWARPIGMWNDEVEINGELKPRFEYLGEL